MSQPGPGLVRDLSFLGIVSLGVGAMIGAGVFILTGLAAGLAGPALMLAFVLNGIIALIVGGCYAELCAMMPQVGGAYVWARTGLGRGVGFHVGWMSWFAHSVACALYAVAFGSFLIELVAPGGGNEAAATISACAIAVILLLVNYMGASDMGRLEVFVTTFKVFILMIVVGFGAVLILGRPDVGVSSYTPFFPEGGRGLVSAMGLTFVAFEGYEIIVQTAEEVRDPERLIPRAIFLSIAIVVVVYLLVSWVILGAIEAPEGMQVYQYLGSLGELGLSEATSQFVPKGRELLLIAGLASAASALNATIFGSTRIALAMGRGGDLPKVFAKVHASHHTPQTAIAVTGTVILAVVVGMPLEDVAAAADILFLFVFVAVCSTVIRLRRSRPKARRPFRMPLSPALPMVGVVSGIALAVALLDVSLRAWVVVTLWVSAGLLLSLRRK